MSLDSCCATKPDHHHWRGVGEVARPEREIHALDGADADAGGGVDLVALQALDDVFLAKLEVVVGPDVLLKFLERLVGKVAPRLNTSSLISKWQGVAPARQTGGQTFGVFVRLSFDASKGDALFLSLDHASGFAIYIEQIIGEAMAG